MKNSLLHRCLAIFILIFTIMCMSCSNDTKDPVAANADSHKQAISGMNQTDTAEAIKNWNLIKAHYQKVVDELSTHSITRKDLNKEILHYSAAQPIDTAFGNAYMEAYRKEISGSKIKNSVYSIILTEQSIAFYLKYLIDHPGDSIIAAFGKYDDVYLQSSRGIRDPVLDTDVRRNYKNQHTLIVGLRNPKRGNLGANENYCRPFELEGQKSFYDDWHNGWPPPIDSAK